MNMQDMKQLMKDFYPRPPRGGRQPTACWLTTWKSISIHALREEGDGDGLRVILGTAAFLSTPSARRATPGDRGPDRGQRKFLSTPSARRATAKTEKNISAFVSL